MGELADYSAWDVSVQRDNCFIPFSKGIIAALNDSRVATTYGKRNQKTLQEIVGHIPVLEGDAYYKIPDPSLVGDDALIHTVSLGSGKLMTASGNNHFNASLREAVMDARSEAGLLKYVELLSTDFMGDDSAAFYKVLPGWNEDIYRKFNDVHVYVAAKNGFRLNFTKSVLSRRYYESLKRTIVAGCYLPRFSQLNEFVAEKVTANQTPMSALRDLRAYLGTMVSRGLPHLYACRFFNAFSILNRAVKMRGDKDKLTQYVLPQAFAYVPLSLKGGGGLPFSMFGASIDSLIALYCSRDEEFSRMINAAANVLDANLPARS